MRVKGRRGNAARERDAESKQACGRGSGRVEPGTQPRCVVRFLPRAEHAQSAKGGGRWVDPCACVGETGRSREVPEEPGFQHHPKVAG